MGVGHRRIVTRLLHGARRDPLLCGYNDKGFVCCFYLGDHGLFDREADGKIDPGCTKCGDLPRCRFVGVRRDALPD